MISKEELRAWLEGQSYQAFSFQDARGRNHVYCKVPKDGRFDYLYTPTYSNEEISMHRDLEYAGIYDRENKKIYDAYGRFSIIDPDIEHPRNANDMQDDLGLTVREIIERCVDNNPNNLEIAELSIRGKEELARYEEYGARNDARTAFLAGKATTDIKYECWYGCVDWEKETELLSYIADPTSYAEKQAKLYFETHQQDILLALKKNEFLRAELSELEQLADSPLHRLRAIISSANGTTAKTLNVTVSKDGKRLTFKMDASALRRDPSTFYSNWEMPAKDRREFEETFGAREHFYPQDIVDISYCGKSIYSAEPYEEPVEAEEISQTM